MKPKIKQNKDSSVIFRRSFAFVLSAFVLLISISVPSFAYTDTSSNGIDFSIQPIAKSNTSNGSDISTNYTFVCNSNNKEMKVSSSPSADVYAYLCSSNNSLILASSSNSAFGYWTLPAGGGGGNALSYFDSTTQLYWWWAYDMKGTYSPSNISVPFFSDYSAGLSAVRDWIDNPPPPPGDPHPVNFSLQAGYVAFVDISNLTGVSASLSTSVFGSAEWSPRVTDQSLGVVSSLPSSFSLPISGTSRISWTGTGSKNVLGQYKTFGYSYSASSAGGSSYLCIVNPLQASQGSQLTAMASMPNARNNPISVSINNARSVKIYSLTASLAVGSGTLDTETNGNTWSGEYDDATDQWAFQNDQTGESTDIDGLPVGGGNDPIIGQTSINDWLQEIANSIKGFFSGAIGAVTTLVSAGSDFIHSLSGLYAWLPAPVYSVLVSALILVITIGVIKVFI